MIKENEVKIDWDKVYQGLEENGVFVIRNIFSNDTCDRIKKLYKDDSMFRSHVVMERYNFGKGEYKYLSYPLPDEIEKARIYFYEKLVHIANAWQKKMGKDNLYTDSHLKFIEMCHINDQKRPTPLILKYKKGDFNCLHQDLYGDIYFPLQVVVQLTEQAKDFNGGELVLTEQKPRMQSKVKVINMDKGDAAVFAVNERPVNGKKGSYKVKMRHGVSEVRNGERYTLGIIFHDAN
ncbi:MAG: hypothetical protein EA345_07170 [Halomonas sp.]|nr:2OG-Fe(II) oxygenase [Halomonas sp.]TVP49261.1 MAG: hypothetical protein EA345_07170 [Halomonas sp.]